ncbi:MAG: C25 family cysteine peptidase, partial [Candidatus Saliniplasma sp.]
MRETKIGAVILISILVISVLPVGLVLSSRDPGIDQTKDNCIEDDWRPARSLRQSDNDVEPVLARSIKKQSDGIVIQYRMPEPELDEVEYQTLNGHTVQRLKFGNAEFHSEPGEPEIPMVPVRIVLPEDQVVESVNIIPDEKVKLSGSYSLSYGEEPQPITCESSEVTPTQPSESIYGSDKSYPTRSYELHETQYGNGVGFAHIDVFPVVYRPLSGMLEYFNTFTVEVETVEDENDSGLRVDLERFEDRHAPSLENLDALNTYKDDEIKGSYQNVIDSRETQEYVFITSQNVAEDDSVDPTVNDLISHRESQGLASTVVTIEYIYDNYGGTEDSDKLRNFIKDAYNNWDTEFVTLGGDTNIIPLKTVYATQGSTSDDLPTDITYQCLDGDEWDEDFTAEVMLGRISGEDPSEISNQIHKILSYETDSGSESYFKTGLGVGEELDDTTYGKEAMLELQTYFSDEWSWDGLYDKDGTWSKQDIIDLINSDSFSVINHLGHSNYNYNMKMSNGDESSFTNDNYIFVKTQGCIPGAFDNDCIAERFTTEHSNGGMFAGVFNSRYGWYQPNDPTGGSSHQLHRSFWEAAWDLDMEYFSEYNEYAHRTHYSDYRWDVLSSNYFGCAATPFRGKGISGEPPEVTVTSPNGGESFTTGTEESISWSTTSGDDPVDYVDMYYSVDTGVNWETIDSNVDDTGSYTWTVPNEDSGDCLVRIEAVDTAGRDGEDQSDSTFTIVGTPPESPSNLVVEYTGSGSQTLFSDDVEGGDLGYTTGTSESQASEWGIRDNGASSGTNSWDFGDGQYYKTSDYGYLSWLITPEIEIPAEADSAELSFDHWRSFGQQTTYLDGGNLKLSTNGVNGDY